MNRNWIRIADSFEQIQFNENNLAEIDANGKTICLGKNGNEIFAFAQKCPHSSGYLVNGFIDALGNVVCPLHRYKFCMKNGRNVSGEGYYLKHWPVEEREDGIYVGLDQEKLFGLF
jgi:nitrite reductase/ring-hydroxylating ferredoxin subunit